jgi:hypothetical protein
MRKPTKNYALIRRLTSIFHRFPKHLLILMQNLIDAESRNIYLPRWIEPGMSDGFQFSLRSALFVESHQPVTAPAWLFVFLSLPRISAASRITTEFSPLASRLDLTVVLLVFPANVFCSY